jgi:hypothetical protein
MKKKAPKQISIETLQQLVETATPENFARLETDLVVWFRVNVALRAAGVKGKVRMLWTDDGKTGLTSVDFTPW